MKRTKINLLLKLEKTPGEILIKGWVRTKRDSKEFCFMEINDGSCLKNIQAIANNDLANYSYIQTITTGTSLSVRGQLVESPGKGQKWEIQASAVEIINLAPESYPLQKKRHSDEFLRTIAHLRPRTNKYGATFRIRSEMAFAIHKFYREKGFRYLTAPLITGSDAEGAGEMFRVTNLDPGAVKKLGRMDFKEDFFGQESNLTVSGQLSAEMFALALGDVYTFGPTFRAENSNTSRHVAEFWMLEPEMAFCDLKENMDHGEELVKYLTQHAINECSEDINLFTSFVDKSLPKLFDTILNLEFGRITYTQAIEILVKSRHKFEFPVEYGTDLQSEHERYLAEVYFKKPVFLTDYPKEIKPFYMRMNDDEKTVAAVDLLVPRIGELIGGSQREERIFVLEKRMEEMNMPMEDYWWYLDSRKFGSAPHSGFGMGFERFLMMITGINNIRDVIPFPRTPGSIDF
ncbi:MAG: asparagine--tRNA ligase [Desulfobacula sp.]|jgi:asparaginyl-tRNA synthetase|uniref:asparagine--tRNA ligase n=1 Tax=Desulfobacula sp. TaxID=2593537 RepID=UPI001D87EF47|nr:asparagine--tRNA ligase [Desulfobacula sp.]MBT3485622.1 asparagine--tRNA ligase [Desulfobacula sp.]MBT3805543.1 asparagine--tRNA ligase [Desulfobacula sp.]MBT4024794.1 asparagine--tRNA ligase [Desulfobacula sp.]MBT4200100.1 asparagine--tRNA ligase [Desulfobacula sp.]